MPKTREQKDVLVKELTERLKRATSLVFADYRGLPVKDVTVFRALCRKEGVDYLVIKKTLLAKALAAASYAGIDARSVEGELAVTMGYGDEVAPAKIVAQFGKTHPLKITGGVLEHRMISASDTAALALLPSRLELLAKLVGTVQAPISGFVNVLAANMRGLVNTLTAIREKKPA